MEILKKLKIELPCDWVIPLLGINPEKTIIQKDTCTPVFIPALFTTARTWKHPNCPSTEMDKEGMVHIYNGILLSHKKERNWVICRDVDGSRDHHTEWNKSEREKQTSNINTYMWNLQKWYRWTYFQSRNRDTDVKLGDWDWHIYTTDTMYKKNLPALQETRVRFLGWEDPLEKEMATPSSILAWRISWTKEPGGLQSMVFQELDTT